MIFDISGQDGSLLSTFSARGGDGPRHSRNLGIDDFRNLRRVTLHAFDPAEFRIVMDVVARVEPAEIYNLSGQTWVLSFDQPYETTESILAATLNILEVIRHQDRRIRVFNAASSECLGNTPDEGADEQTAF